MREGSDSSSTETLPCLRSCCVLQVNISQADMQAIGNTITMVTQDGTTITVPAHDAVISSAGTHSVAMVTAEGTEGQQVRHCPAYLGHVPLGAAIKWAREPSHFCH